MKGKPNTRKLLKRDKRSFSSMKKALKRKNKPNLIKALLRKNTWIMINCNLNLYMDTIYQINVKNPINQINVKNELIKIYSYSIYKQNSWKFTNLKIFLKFTR